MSDSYVKIRLVVLSFLQFAVWGSYLTSMGRYLGSYGLGAEIGWFYSVQGLVSIFMPAIIGVVADRWVPAQRLLSFCHIVAALFMAITGYVAFKMDYNVAFNDIFWTYTVSVAFYMPTLALSNSVSYTALEKAGLDTVKSFPFIRVFGTVGFIISMLIVDYTGLQNNCVQFFVSATWGVLLALYSLSLPHCPVNGAGGKKSLFSALGLEAFRLFAKPKMAVFFIFSMLLGVALQISNGYANLYISGFGDIPQYAGAYVVEHTNVLISLSQVSETLCILLIPYFLGRFGIKRVMLIAMIAWVLRFLFLGVGNPGMPGVMFFVMSMLVYGVAFDFFNISGSLFVDNEVPEGMRSGAQGLFMLMTNGLGASVGVMVAQGIVNYFTQNQTNFDGWSIVWCIFAGYALFIAVLFAFVFKEKRIRNG